MNIGIVGLGLIGGSYAKSLKKYGYKIYGIDINQDTIEYALNNEIIDYGSTDPKSILNMMDVVFLCLYPEDTVRFVRKNINNFKRNSIVSDVVGVKRKLIDSFEVYKDDDIEFVYTHPISGKEKVGIKYSDEAIFHDANFVITPTKFNKEESLNLIETIAKQIGFKTISRITDIEHDKIIAYTSQLTHAIAISLVNSGSELSDPSAFIGDSYKDLTRIAMINESLWSELFIHNKDFLIRRISSFEDKLSELKKAISSKDKDKIMKLMCDSKERRGNIL